jgi:hypothetical protein
MTNDYFARPDVQLAMYLYLRDIYQSLDESGSAHRDSIEDIKTDPFWPCLNESYRKMAEKGFPAPHGGLDARVKAEICGQAMKAMHNTAQETKQPSP